MSEKDISAADKVARARSKDEKSKGKQRSLRDVAEAQRVMRREMEQGVHKGKRSDYASTENLGAAPAKLGDVLDDVVGPETGSPTDIVSLAHQIIVEHGDGLVLGIKQWSIVQRLVEQGIWAGISRSA